MTVAENVAFGLRYKKVGKAETARRVGEAMELVQLGELASRRPSQLSGGQQQRVALARAIVLEPPVLLLDEPLGALDARLRVDLQVELKRIQETLGITFVYVTHDQDEALTMSDRVAVMKGGRVEQCGEPRVLVRGAGDRVRGQLPRHLEPDPGEVVGRRAARARRVLAALRGQRAPRRGAGDDPARARQARAARGRAARTAMPGMVEAVVYMGFHQDVRVRLANGALIHCDVPNDGTALEPASGDPVCVHLPAELPAGAGAVRRREELVTAARRVIGRDGFAAATVGTITREAGASLGLLNYHFGSKDEVVAEAFAAAAREDLAALEAISRRFEDPAERLAAYLDQSEWEDAESWRLWVDAWGESVHSPLVRDTLGRFDIGWRAVLAEVLADGVRQGCWECADPQDTAARLVAVLDGIGLHTTVHGEDVPPGPRDRLGAPAGRARAGRDRCPRRRRRSWSPAGRARARRPGSRSARATSTPTATSIRPPSSRSSRRRARPGSARACRTRSSPTSPSATCGRWAATR